MIQHIMQQQMNTEQELANAATTDSKTTESLERSSRSSEKRRRTGMVETEDKEVELKTVEEKEKWLGKKLLQKTANRTKKRSKASSMNTVKSAVEEKVCGLVETACTRLKITILQSGKRNEFSRVNSNSW